MGAEILWLIAAVAVPLPCNPWGGSGFELPKVVLLRALALLLLLAAVLMRPPLPRRFSALGAAVLGFGLAAQRRPIRAIAREPVAQHGAFRFACGQSTDHRRSKLWLH